MPEPMTTLRPWEMLQRTELANQRVELAGDLNMEWCIVNVLDWSHRLQDAFDALRFEDNPAGLVNGLVAIAALCQRTAEDLGLLRHLIGPVPAGPPAFYDEGESDMAENE